VSATKVFVVRKLPKEITMQSQVLLSAAS